jgi:hypothetical protein
MKKAAHDAIFLHILRLSSAETEKQVVNVLNTLFSKLKKRLICILTSTWLPLSGRLHSYIFEQKPKIKFLA